MEVACSACAAKDEEILALRITVAELTRALTELEKVRILQAADLERVKSERERFEPNRAERLPASELQLAFETVLEADRATNACTGEDEATAHRDDAPAGGAHTTPESPGSAGEPHSKPDAKAPPKRNDKRSKKKHGRRDLDLAHLPIQTIEISPPEVLLDPSKWLRIGQESADRVAYRTATYLVLRVIRPKYRLKETADASPSDDASTGADGEASRDEDRPRATIVCAEIPGFFWPRLMADVSAVTHVILSKYDLCLPLHRQERASPRCGLYMPRSTQCEWISTAYAACFRIVDAMMEEACRSAFCIATDATSAPVRTSRRCAPWHVFVFVADSDHVVFRVTRHHTSDAIKSFLGGFSGLLLSDASAIYDDLRSQGIVQAYCWFHMRRYFWRCRATEPVVAMEALSIISKLFEVARDTLSLEMPERTEERARQARPLLELFDRRLDCVRRHVDAGSPLEAALTYYNNQREGLRTFLSDARIRLDNNISEQQLRHLALGRHNWMFFENATGARWYSVFRSLIASCALHGLEPQEYFNDILRLAPHWPTSRVLELAPKHWRKTRTELDASQREVIEPSWIHAFNGPPVRAHNRAA